MRVATWNIGGGYISPTGNLEFSQENLEYFISALKEIQPDIVCFQETHASRLDQPKEIAQALGFRYVAAEPIADSHLKAGEKLALAIVSRYPITQSKFYKLTNPNLQCIWKGKVVPTHDKGFLEAYVDCHGVSIRVLSGHMVPFHRSKRDFLEGEFEGIRSEIEGIICAADALEIVCADMNYEDVCKLLPGVFAHELASVLEDKPTEAKGRKYDKIFVSKDWRLISSRIIPGKADHYLCYADLELV